MDFSSFEFYLRETKQKRENNNSSTDPDLSVFAS